nr:MAG TPA: hypothetical protein [Caudoviricetes sp.]
MCYNNLAELIPQTSLFSFPLAVFDRRTTGLAVSCIGTRCWVQSPTR